MASAALRLLSLLHLTAAAGGEKGVPVHHGSAWYTLNGHIDEHKAKPESILLQVRLNHEDVGIPALGFDDELKLAVTIVHIDETGAMLPANMRLKVQESEEGTHFVPSMVVVSAGIPGGASATVNVTLTPSGATRSFESMPTALRIQLCSESGDVLIWGLVDMPLHLYSLPFEDLLPCSATINMLTIGFPGVGKTTFFKTLATALSPEVQEVSNIGGGAGHVTRKITVYRLRDWVANPDVMIDIVDTWGITKESFTGEFLGQLCEGAVPDGYSMHRYSVSNRYEAISSTHSRPMSTALFFIRASQSKDSELMGIMREHVVQITEQGYNSLVIVTWLVDWNPHDIPNLLANIAVELQIPSNRVMPFYGYVNETAKDPRLDRNVLEILQRAVDHGQMFEKLQRLEREKRRESTTCAATEDEEPLAARGQAISRVHIIHIGFIIGSAMAVFIGLTTVVGRQGRAVSSLLAILGAIIAASLAILAGKCPCAAVYWAGHPDSFAGALICTVVIGTLSYHSLLLLVVSLGSNEGVSLLTIFCAGANYLISAALAQSRGCP